MPTLPRRSTIARAACFFSAALAVPPSVHAVVVRGTVQNALGTPVPGSRVNLIQGGQQVAYALAGPDGTFEVRSTASGRFTLNTVPGATQTALAPNVSRDFFGGATDVVTRTITLEANTLTGSPTRFWSISAT